MASRDQSPDRASESTPLLRDGESQPHAEPQKVNRLPSYIALGILCIAAVLAIVFGFATPAATEEYAKEAVTFKPNSLSIDSFTDVGVRARVQGVFYLDAAKVHKKTVRDLGRAATWIAKEVESGYTDITIRLPEYDDVLLGTVTVPPIKVNIRNGHENIIDIVADIERGDIDGVRTVLHDFLGGKSSLEVKAVASVSIKSGIFSLGTQVITQQMTLERENDMKIPDFDIAHLKVTEHSLPGHIEGLRATAQILTTNPYPIEFDIPPVEFEVLLPDCEGKPLMLGQIDTDLIHVPSKGTVNADAAGFIHELPTALTQACPGTQRSPLDVFIGSYLDGRNTSVYIRGGRQDTERTPAWIGDILRDTVVEVPVPVHSFDNMIKDFSLSNVQFSLPELDLEYPTVSANVNVVVGLPKDIDVSILVDRIRADAAVYYNGRELGKLDLHAWQQASSWKIEGGLQIQSEVRDAPLRITDQDVFGDVLRAMIFGNGVSLSVHANVDVSSTTVLGQFVVRQIPAKGDIHIDPLGGKFKYTVKNIAAIGSSVKELIIQTKVEVNNPTNYSATIPHANVSISCNGTQLGHAWGAFHMRPGLNELAVQASYAAGPVGAELLSQYISGHNPNLTVQTHIGSFPGLPNPHLSVDVPIPHVFGKFLKETTMHILSSTATFVLDSPLAMTITSIDAKSYYQGEVVGTVFSNEWLDIEVGENLTPGLPVDWDLDVGLKLLKDALGGTLKLDAHADVGVKIGKWRQKIWYEAKGMGAQVKLL